MSGHVGQAESAEGAGEDSRCSSSIMEQWNAGIQRVFEQVAETGRAFDYDLEHLPTSHLEGNLVQSLLYNRYDVPSAYVSTLDSRTHSRLAPAV